MKIKELPLGVEIKRHYCGEYRVRRTKDCFTTTRYVSTLQEAMKWVKYFANEDKQKRGNKK